MKRLLLLLVALAAPAAALDRNAFTFTKYDLDVRLQPGGDTPLRVSGRVTLRNDSSAPQTNLSLQLASTFEWTSITVGGKPVQYLAQTYTSDIDHTGELWEAVVTLPAPVAPKAEVELEVGYRGGIPQHHGRLKRIEVPEEAAAAADWDRIDAQFTAFRGIGYSVWYPVAMESVNLAEGDAYFNTLDRWRGRHADAVMNVKLTAHLPQGQALVMPGFTASACAADVAVISGFQAICGSTRFAHVGTVAPLVAAGQYVQLEKPGLTLIYLRGSDAAANEYGAATDRLSELVTKWLGPAKDRAVVVQLPEASWAPYESGAWMFTPFYPDRPRAEIAVVHQLTHAALPSARPWIFEGVAHFLQVLVREQQAGRRAALQFLEVRRPALAEAEKDPPKTPEEQAARSLINSRDEIFMRGKAIYAWWMLREMLGDAPLQAAFKNYRADQDKEPSYMQRLIQAQTPKPVEWFFDDWVYRDKGLPDFRIASIYPRPSLAGGFLVTVTVENLGDVGAEVPVSVRATGGVREGRVLVPAKQKGVARIQMPQTPLQASVNDGSVPEAVVDNNTEKVEAPPPQ